MHWNVRPFDGSLCDAQGIIRVDRATFGDCPYAPEDIVALVASPGQYVCVAEEEGCQIVGFASAFPTRSLAADRWEVDELAVHPSWQGQGIGASLVARTVHEGARHWPSCQARALVATNNLASQRVFRKNGFSKVAKVDLLLYQVSGRVPRPPQAEAPHIRTAAQAADAPIIAELSGCSGDRAAALLKSPENSYWVAGAGHTVQGYMELIHVHTLRYEGFWIESLAVAGRNDRLASALFSAAIREAKRRDAIDEVGYLARPRERGLYAAAVREGFKRVNEYLILEQEWVPQ